MQIRLDGTGARPGAAYPRNPALTRNRPPSGPLAPPAARASASAWVPAQAVTDPGSP